MSSADHEIAVTEPPPPATWNIRLLTAGEGDRRNRRTLDAITLVIAAIVTGTAAVIAHPATAHDSEVGRALAVILGWAAPLWRFACLGSALLVVVIAVAAVVRRRWALVRDIAVTLALVAMSAVTLGGTVTADWWPFDLHPLARWGFPEPRIAAVIAVLAVTAPDLTRPVRTLGRWLAALCSIGVVALGVSLPSSVLGGVAVGIAAAAVVRCLFGTSAGFPAVSAVRGSVAALGVELAELVVADTQRVGSALYVGRTIDGAVIRVKVLGRDAQDTQRLARHWRLLAFRDPPRSVGDGRLDQVEHEALATLLAGRAGANVPEIVTVGMSDDGDALIVLGQPTVEPLESLAATAVDDRFLEDLWEQVGRLHDAGISHGRLNASNILPVAGRPMLVDWSAATIGAPQSALDIDVAELLVACAVLVGPERTLAKAVAAGWGASIGRVLPYLQRAALTPHLRDLARSHEVVLDELRSSAAIAAGVDVPELVPMRRVRAKDLLMMAAVVFAAYLLIGQLADIGFGTIRDELRQADPAWALVGLVLAQCALIGSGISVRGAVRTPLALLPCVVLQAAIKFVNLTVPSSAGRIGMNLRFLQRMGAPRSEAVAAGAVDDVSETLVQVTLLLVSLALVDVDLDTSSFQGAGPDRRLLVGIAVALVVGLVVVLTVPRIHDKVVPGVRSGLSSLWAVARVRRKRIELFGGNIASELLYALALGSICLAYGAHISLAGLVFVNTAASILSSLIPVPGGIGAAEASLSAGLIALGVDESTAFAIALTQRLCTFYLPPIWGYVSLRWLGRHGYV